jgi:hypothetical protein
MSNGILLPHEVDQIVNLGEAIGKERLELDMIDQMKVMEQRRFELAKAAMQGLLSDINNIGPAVGRSKSGGMPFPEDIAKHSVDFANALLAALEERR